MRITALVLALCLVCAAARAYESGSPEPAAAGRYTFAWPLGEGALKPRGGSTRGTAVTLDREPAQAWTRLQESGLSDFERDRRAILAMAGPYRVSFDFLEIARFDADMKPDAPYQSWGTEHVFVAADQGDFIALQHILVMRMLGPDGVAAEPLVTRHWRQEWRYQADAMLAYQGSNVWELRSIPPGERSGTWVQSVFQVDDSPRYAAQGRWQHSASFSTWLSAETWRPLPRREWSVRDDYQVLAGTNRHTITATGWLQEENNLKLALDAGAPRATLPYLAREYGVARYERIKDFDFAPARAYFDRTEPFWNEVRTAWQRLIQRDGRVELRTRVDQAQLFAPFFDYAQGLARGEPFMREEARAFIDSTLRRTYFVEPAKSRG